MLRWRGILLRTRVARAARAMARLLLKRWVIPVLIIRVGVALAHTNRRRFGASPRHSVLRPANEAVAYRRLEICGWCGGDEGLVHLCQRGVSHLPQLLHQGKTILCQHVLHIRNLAHHMIMLLDCRIHDSESAST